MMRLTFGLFTQVSGSGPLGPLVFFFFVLHFSALYNKISGILLSLEL